MENQTIRKLINLEKDTLSHINYTIYDQFCQNKNGHEYTDVDTECSFDLFGEKFLHNCCSNFLRKMELIEDFDFDEAIEEENTNENTMCRVSWGDNVKPSKVRNAKSRALSQKFNPDFVLEGSKAVYFELFGSGENSHFAPGGNRQF